MPGITITRWVILGCIVLVIVADAILVACKQPTISYGLTWLMRHWSLGWWVPFALGLLVGHWCWGTADAAVATVRRMLHL